MNIVLRILLPTLMASVSISVPARAQEAPPSVTRITLAEALALFGRNNLDLRSARAQAAEAVALARQSAAFPNPMLTGSHEPLSDGDDSYSESYLGVSQRIEWPATRNARQTAATRLAAAAIARLAADSVRLAFGVKQAYVEAVRAEHIANLLGRVTDVFRGAERSATERLREGDISVYEARRIAVERRRYEAALAEAQLDASAARRTLAVLVAPEAEAAELVPADTVVTPPMPDTIDVTLAFARRPEIVAARAELEAARAAADVARRERVPDVTATSGYKRQSDGLTGLHLGLSFPIPLWDRGAGDVAAADARVDAASARLALEERRIANDVRRALEVYRSHVRRAALLAAPLSAEAADLLSIAQLAYDAGEMDLVALLDAADALRAARTLEARFRADFWTSYFDLERALGRFDPATDKGDDE